MKAADITEKVAFFEAYGSISGGDGVSLLGGLLNKKGFLGKREPTEVRAAPALGLGRIASDEARTALQQASRDDDPVVRSNVSRALRTEEQKRDGSDSARRAPQRGLAHRRRGR